MLAVDWLIGGLVSFVREMIWVEDVFVRHREVLQSPSHRKVRITVTSLMPHFKGGSKIKYFTGDDRGRVSIRKLSNSEAKGKIEQKEKNDSDSDVDCCTCVLGSCAAVFCCPCVVSYWCCCDDDCDAGDKLAAFCGVICCPCVASWAGREIVDKALTSSNSSEECGSLLDALLEVEHSNKAHDIFQIEPMKQLIRDHWFVHQWWTVVMLLVHMVYMTFYGLYSLDTIRKAYQLNRTNINISVDLKVNQAFISWPIVLVAPDVLFWIGPPIYFLLSCFDDDNSNRVKRKEGLIKHVKNLVTIDTIIDVKDTLN